MKPALAVERVHVAFLFPPHSCGGLIEAGMITYAVVWL